MSDPIDELEIFYDGREPLTKELMNSVVRALRLARESAARWRGSGSVASHDVGGGGATVEAGEALTAAASESELLASRTRGTSTAAPFSGMPKAGTKFDLELIIHPGTGAYALGSTSVSRVDQVPGGLDPRTGTPPATALYSQPGYLATSARRNKPARLWLLYVTGNLTGGTFRLGYGGAWTAPLPHSASSAQVEAAVRTLPGLSGAPYSPGTLAMAAVGQTDGLPFLVCPTGDSAAELLTGEALAVDSQVTGSADALGLSPQVICALVTVGRSPGAGYHWLPLAIFGNATGGTFRLTWRGQTTAPIPLTTGVSTAQAIATALAALPGLSIGPADVAAFATSGGTTSPEPPATQPARGWRVHLAGTQEDLAHWLPLRLLTSGLTGGSPVADADVVRTPDRWIGAVPADGFQPASGGSSSFSGDYGDIGWNVSLPNPVSQWADPDTYLALVGSAAPVLQESGPSAADHVGTSLLWEYAHPGGYSGGLTASPVVERTDGTALGSVVTRALGPYSLDDDRVAFRPWSVRARSAAQSGDPVLARASITDGFNFQGVAGLVNLAPTASRSAVLSTLLVADLQRPAIDLVRVGQQCVVGVGPGQPRGIADGWLERPRAGDPPLDSAYGDGLAYVWLVFRDDHSGGSSGGWAWGAPPSLGRIVTQPVTSANLMPISNFRVGESRCVAFRNGRDQDLPYLTALLDGDGGASADLISGAFAGVFDDALHVDTVVWANDLVPGVPRHRSVSQGGLGQLGQVVNGRLTTGPSLGMQSSYSLPSFSNQNWFSCGYVADGYVCSTTYTSPFGGVGPGNHVLNPRWPVRLRLSATGVSVAEGGQSDPCLLAALAGGVTLDSTGIDVSGRVGYGDAVELAAPFPPAAGTKQAYFGTGLTWAGQASACGGTVHFLLSAGSAEIDSGRMGYPHQKEGLFCRLYAFWNATPPLAMPHHGLQACVGRGPGLPLRGSAAPWLLPPGLVGVSQVSHVQSPLEGNTAAPWSFRVPVGCAGEPAGVRCCIDFVVDFVGSPPSWTYPLSDPDSDADWSGLSFPPLVVIPSVYWADYSGSVEDSRGAMRATTLLGRCASLGTLRLTLIDSSGGQFGQANLFSRFRTMAAEGHAFSRAHQRGWEIGGVPGFHRCTYLAMLAPTAYGGYQIVFCRYEPMASFETGSGDAPHVAVTGFRTSGLSQYVPINARDPGTGVMTGPLVWTGGCAAFSLAGTVRLDEPGVGSAIVNVFVTL